MEAEPDDEHDDDSLQYRERQDIVQHELVDGLSSLRLLGDDPYLRMQVFNLSIVDQFIMELEELVLAKLLHEERAPIETTFLSAQSQMWIFAAYEILRTWRQRAREVLRLGMSGGLTVKLAELKKDEGFQHIGREIRADQIQGILDDPGAIAKIEEDLRVAHIPFANIEYIRVALAKHEVRGKKNSIAYAPGYGRINQWSGSLDYQLESGRVILGNISRRDIADELRALTDRKKIPTAVDLDDFDKFMKGPHDDPFTKDNHQD